MLDECFLYRQGITELPSPQEQQHMLELCVKDTFCSLHDLTDKETFLPIDRVNRTGGVRLPNISSMTDIGLQLACFVAARDLGLLSAVEAQKRAYRLASVLKRLRSTGAVRNGLYTNWITLSGKPFYEFGYAASSVDHAWLYTGFEIAEHAFLPLADIFSELKAGIRFNEFYDEKTGLISGMINMQTEEKAPWVYGNFHSEARQAGYIGIAQGLPETVILNMRFPKPEKSGNGTAFEEFMPTLMVDEPPALHEKYFAGMVRDGLERNNGFWGLSSCDTPDGYKECGVKDLAENDIADTTVITPHASFLTWGQDAGMSALNLQKIQQTFPCYRANIGFLDAVEVRTGHVIESQTHLDQSMSFLAQYNALTKNGLHEYVPEINAAAAGIMPQIHQRVNLN